MLIDFTRVIAHTGSICIEVGLHLDEIELGEAVECRLNRDLKAGLKGWDQVLIVHIDDCEVDTINQVFLLNDHIALDYAIERHQNDHVCVQDVAAHIVQELHHAEGRTLDWSHLTQLVMIECDIRLLCHLVSEQVDLFLPL